MPLKCCFSPNQRVHGWLMKWNLWKSPLLIFFCVLFNGFFFFVVTNTLLLGLVQCNGCKKVDLGLVVYSFRDQICWEETMIGWWDSTMRFKGGSIGSMMPLWICWYPMCVEEMLSGTPLGIKTLFLPDISGMLKGILSSPGLVVSISISSAGFLRRNLPLVVLGNGKTSMGMCLWFLLMRIYWVISLSCCSDLERTFLLFQYWSMTHW